MIRTFNITTCGEDVARFRDSQSVRTFTDELGLDGIELMLIGSDSTSIYPVDLIKGLHLDYKNSWYDFYINDENEVNREFGSMAEAQRWICNSPTDLSANLRHQLDIARALKVKYVVYHVSNVTLEETLTFKFRHESPAIIDAALEIINAALAGQSYDFDFLVENLWWPGFTFTEPDLTEHLLDGIKYSRVGIMLDTGHLMHTNIAIDDANQGIDYIKKCLDAHGELCRYIRGMHLHDGASGAFIRDLITNPVLPEGDYFKRLCGTYESVLKMDPHKPLICSGTRDLIDRISPDYLTYEFITTSLDEHRRFISAQNTALGF